MSTLPVKRLSSNAILPVRGSEFSAGYDLFALEETFIQMNCQTLVSTGISIALNPGTYGRIAPRSGLAFKHGLMTLAGVIDQDYRGEVKVMLLSTNKNITLQKGERIAQLIIEVIQNPEITEVDELPSTSRGQGGFGSTGQF